MLVCDCQHQRLTEEEEVEEDAEEEARVMLRGDWLLPYQRGRAKVGDWWGWSCRLIIKSFRAALSPLLNSLHSASNSLSSLSSYLASEVARGARRGGRRSVEA
ncbi:unnamed protein product [Pleuronectes platessa]|uniref:Uncharacterized protein n=1 Tax=Pleuronectes platessa TaxID=8262 RepID=A0A9N7YPZ8_PLEPL|nr:unnamed protein product [Pleuronectes platessa]